jgi:hypothetical protein
MFRPGHQPKSRAKIMLLLAWPRVSSGQGQAVQSRPVEPKRGQSRRGEAGKIGGSMYEIIEDEIDSRAGAEM